MACRREAVEAIGGLEVLADYLADDYQLGNRLAGAGWRVALSPDDVESMPGGESVTAILARQLRWCRTMRVSRPGGYFAQVVKDPLLALILVGSIFGFTMPAAGAVMLLYLVKAVVATLLSRVYVRDMLLPRYLWLLPLRDIVTFVAWLLAYTGSSISWRGDRFCVLPGGKMVKTE